MEKPWFVYKLDLLAPYTDPKSWTQSTQETAKAHFEYLQKAHQDGILFLAGRTDYAPGTPDLFGIAVFQADGDAEARRFMEADPAILGGLMRGALHPFRMAFGPKDPSLPKI